MDQRGSDRREAVQHPGHYGGGDNPYEVIKVLEAWDLNANARLWNTVKYIARAGKKDPAKTVEDLKKARFYLDREIERLEAEARVVPVIWYYDAPDWKARGGESWPRRCWREWRRFWREWI